ncbi:uncharacterized protein EAE97_009750 [Botrytis byssoidea]|uniref:FAD-binding domain-containing protein n=1 Tax=Botrytis byssoidea TaxID=139641 RepID=A0A9P5I474_9HELO|nr:uncharacterized protein EAE97_009750 [Botrytis byssoidea]KAF7928908.1 hypothetical protein EAE97_009750 [Botrytis byssoidea]
MAANTEMHLGLGHVVTHPVDRGETMNVIACTVTKEGWADPHRFARAATEQDTLNELTSASKNVTNILSLLNRYVDTWVIFDILDHPASTYAKERKVSIGDAAHSTSPYHGSGAGFANEDFAVLAELLVTPAVKAHNGLLAGSRPNRQPDEWQAEDVGADTEKIATEAYERSEKNAGMNRNCSQS